MVRYQILKIYIYNIKYIKNVLSETSLTNISNISKVVLTVMSDPNVLDLITKLKQID